MSKPERVMLDTVMDFLRKHAPYDQMDAASLEYAAAAAQLSYHPRGSLLVAAAGNPADRLYIILRGTVHGRFVDQPQLHDELEYSAGESFPISAVLGRRASTADYRATEDCFCYSIGVDAVERLLELSPPFQRYCTRHIDALLRQAYQRVQASYAQGAGADQAMLTPLGEVLKREPVTCAPGTPLGEALGLMNRHRVGSIVIAAADGVPCGIFTERDLLRRTAEGRVNIEEPIDVYMTADAVSLPASANVADAALAMARHGIRHVLVLKEGRVAGVLSERALFALQRLSMGQITQAIELADDSASLARAAGSIRELARNMLAQGVAAESLTQLIAALNDRLTARVLALEAARAGLDGIELCWLSLGSEGRNEQTFSTDQDNALLFAPVQGENPAATRMRLLPFAAAVNEALDACGFPLCRGGIMARNPDWCLSAEEWREKFSAWVRNPSPAALLNANIFFDFRALWGEERLAQSLRAWLRELVAKDERFLRMMAANALETRPPLGFFGGIVTEGTANALDLKAQGTRVFVDAARILALAAGVDATSTAARLRLSAQALHVAAGEAEATVSAFYYLLLLRLRRQHLEPDAAIATGSAGNRVDPDSLNELDRRILKEAFLQGRRLQQRLALDYQL